MLEKKDLNTNFDFTTDTPFFWDKFWDNKMGHVFVDPDKYSTTLKYYHQILWSKQLPCGDFLDLQIGTKTEYLTWKNFRFGSDSLSTSFRYKKYEYMITKLMNSLPNYKIFIENYTHLSYTIGGFMIFPKKTWSINQARGCNPYIIDRFDLTLDCIRKYYNNENSPLFTTLKNNKNFFDLFIDFQGFVDFFFLQDLVSNDYNTIIFWLGNGINEKYPFPKTVDEYLLWINNQLTFIDKRNKRIANYIK